MLSRITKGTLNVALIFIVIAVASIVLPQFVPGLPGEEFYSIIGIVAGGLALIVLIYGFLTGGKSDDDNEGVVSLNEIPNDDEEEVEVFTTTTMSDIQDNIKVKETRAERNARKNAEKAAKKEAAAQAKFEKQAQKEAEKAAKKAKRGKGKAKEEEEEWFSNLKSESSTATLQLEMEPDLVSEENTYVEENYYAELSDTSTSATAFPSYDEPIEETPSEIELEEIESFLPEEEIFEEEKTELPEWATASYEDPNFVPPFLEGGKETIRDAEEYIDEQETFDEEGLLIEPFGGITKAEEEVLNVVEEETFADEAEEEIFVSAEPVVTEEEEALNVVEEAEEEVLNVVEEETFADEAEEDDDEYGMNPAERFDALTIQIDELMDKASIEVSRMREKAQQERGEYEREVLRLQDTINEFHHEIERLSTQIESHTQEKQEMFEMKARLLDAEITAANALGEQVKAENSFRKLRIALLSREPVDHSLLSIVDDLLHQNFGGVEENTQVEVEHEEITEYNQENDQYDTESNHYHTS